jgi:hypothetical protein
MCHEMCVLVTSTYSTSNLIVTHPRHHDAAPRDGTSPSGRRFLPADGRSSLVSHGCQTVPLARPKQAAPSSPPDAKPTYGTFLFLDPHVGWTRGTTPRPAASGSISRKERGHAARARGPRASILYPPRPYRNGRRATGEWGHHGDNDGTTSQAGVLHRGFCRPPWVSPS